MGLYEFKRLKVLSMHSLDTWRNTQFSNCLVVVNAWKYPHISKSENKPWWLNSEAPPVVEGGSKSLSTSYACVSGLKKIGLVREMSQAPSLPRFRSPFLCCPLKLSSPTASFPSYRPKRNQRSPSSYPCIRALDLDQNTAVAISVGLASVALGIGIPVFYESQIDNAAKRDNTQPCFPCNGTGAQKCRFCMGNGSITVELGGDDKEVSRCINCDGAGSLTCTTCQGSGIQPRYLDRREFKDDD